MANETVTVTQVTPAVTVSAVAGHTLQAGGDINGPLNLIGALTVGQDDTGHDVKFYGATTGRFMHWDESADKLTISGDFDVTGTTTSFSSTVVKIADPIFTLGGTDPPGTDDNKDRGIEFHYHDGASPRVGFFGYDDSASAFTFLTAATNTSEVFSGTAGTLHAQDYLAGSSGKFGWSGDADTYVYNLGDRIIFSVGGLGFADFKEGTQDIIHLNYNENQDIDFRVGYNGGVSIFSEGSSGNVGIGTDSPAAPLTAKVGTSGTEDKVFELVSNDDRALSILQPNNADNDDAWTFATNNAYTFRVDAIDAFNITSAGNVGIGTTSPSELIHAEGSGDIKFLVKSTTSSAYTIYDSATSGSDAIFGGFQANRAGDSVASIFAKRDGANDAAYIAFDTQATGGAITERMRIDSSGNVGIGDATPTHKLTVNGTIFCNNDLRLGSESVKVVGGSNTIAFQTASTSRMHIDASGNVGIGTASPTYMVHITGATTATLGIQSGSNNAEGSKLRLTEGDTLNGGFIHYDGNANALNIGVHDPFNTTLADDTNVITIPRDTGRVGINTTAPSSLLDVRGDAGYPGILTLSTAELTVEASNQLGRIDFVAPLESSGTDSVKVGASITALAVSDFTDISNTTDLIFSTAISETATEKMRLTSAGDLKLNGTDSKFYAHAAVYFGEVGNHGIINVGSTGYGLSVYCAGGHLNINAATGAGLGWSSGHGAQYTTPDLLLMRDAANILAQRNSTNAQESRIYGTWTDASNYTRLSLSDDGAGDVTIAAETAGTGTDNIDIKILSAGTGGVLLSVAAGYVITADQNGFFPSHSYGMGMLGLPGNPWGDFYMDGDALIRGDAGSPGLLTLATKELTVVDGDVLGKINFQAPLHTVTGDSRLVAAAIWAEANATFAADNNTTDLVFATGASEVAAEKMRLDSAGTLTVKSTASAWTKLFEIQSNGTKCLQSTINAPLELYHSGVRSHYFAWDGHSVRSDAFRGWSDTTTAPLGGGDVRLYRDAAATLAQRNGTNSQTFKVYGTWSDASNYTRLSLSDGGTGSITIAAETAGTGTDDVNINIMPAGTGKIGIGIAAPAGTLHLDDGGTRGILFTNSTTGSTATNGTYMGEVGHNFAIINQAPGSLTLGTSNTNRVVIDSAGNTSFTGGMTYGGVRSISDNTDLLTTDYFLHASLSGYVTVTIPTAQCIPGRTFIIKDIYGYAGSYPISVTCEGSETIDGNSTLAVVSTAKGAAMLICATSSTWFTCGMNDVA